MPAYRLLPETAFGQCEGRRGCAHDTPTLGTNSRLSKRSMTQCWPVVDVVAQLQRSPSPPSVEPLHLQRRFVHHLLQVTVYANCRRCCRPMHFHANECGSPDPLPRAINLTTPTSLVGPDPDCLRSNSAGMTHPPEHHRHALWCSSAQRSSQLWSEDIGTRGLKVVTFRVAFSLDIVGLFVARTRHFSNRMS